MSRFKIFRLLAVIAIGSMFLLAGCGGGGSTGSKLSKANFDKLKTGMTQSEVEAILGPGDIGGNTESGVPGKKVTSKTEVWKDGPKSIVVVYVNDKAQSITPNNL